MCDSLQRGERPFASHLLYTQTGILDDTKPEERKFGIEAGFAWWECADMVVFYLDYGVSAGMIDALMLAARREMSVDFRRIGLNP